jgi:hypothetical protein
VQKTARGRKGNETLAIDGRIAKCTGKLGKMSSGRTLA